MKSGVLQRVFRLSARRQVNPSRDKRGGQHDSVARFQYRHDLLVEPEEECGLNLLSGGMSRKSVYHMIDAYIQLAFVPYSTCTASMMLIYYTLIYKQ